MRLIKWLFLVVLLGVLTGVFWAGHQTAHAPGIGDRETPPSGEVAPTPPPPRPPDILEPYLRFIRHAEDVETLEALLEEEGAMVYHAHLALARVYREEEDLLESIQHYQEALSLYHSAGVLREHAEVLEDAGRHEDACALWQRLLPQVAAAEAVQRLCHPLEAAIALNRAGLFSQALTALTDQTAPGVERERARAHVGLGEHHQALAHFRNHLEYDPDDAQTRVEFAAALDRTGDAPGALVEYQRAGPEGMRARGRLLERLGRPDQAIEAYALSPDAEALWRAAQMLEARGERARTHQIYERLVDGKSRLADDAALRLYLYHHQQGESDAAQGYVPDLSLALAYLAGVFDASWRLVDDPVLVAIPPALSRADALLEHFTLEWSLIEVEILTKGASSGERIAVGEWLVDKGLYHRAVRLGMGMLSHTPSPAVYELAYPRAYQDLVLAASSEFNVDPCLVWAVMREESHFRPDALSWADARGLMQVIPSTGEWIAQRLGEKYRGQALYEPEVSIRYGTWYLAHLTELFDGELAKVVAAYNGGPGSVNRWLNSPVYREPADLPGVATFPETREYIDKVLSSWLVYRWLYGE